MDHSRTFLVLHPDTCDPDANPTRKTAVTRACHDHEGNCSVHSACLSAHPRPIFLYTGQALVITLETGAVLQRSSEALDGIPYVHTGSAALHLTWCVSLQIDHGTQHFVSPSTLSPQDVARGYSRCRVIFVPFLRGRLSLTALDGKLTRCRPLAGSTVESFGKTAVSLSSNVLASCSSPASLSIKPDGYNACSS